MLGRLFALRNATFVSMGSTLVTNGTNKNLAPLLIRLFDGRYGWQSKFVEKLLRIEVRAVIRTLFGFTGPAHSGTPAQSAEEAG